MDKVILQKEMEWVETREDSESMRETYLVDFQMVSVGKSGEMEIGTSETSSMDTLQAKENITRCLLTERLKANGQKMS